jgi:hypothetical protein
MLFVVCRYVESNTWRHSRTLRSGVFVGGREEHDTSTIGGEQQKLKAEGQREKETGKIKEIENKKNVIRK